MSSYINDNKLSLNNYPPYSSSSEIRYCEDYDDAITHRYVIRRVSPRGKHWWHGAGNSDAMIEFIKKNVNDGNETHEVICNDSERVRHLLFFDIDAPCKLFDSDILSFNRFIKLLHIKITQIITGASKPKILRCDRADKHSAHIVYNVSIQSNHAKCIPHYLIAEMGNTLESMGMSRELMNVIDMNVYNSVSSMRIMGSPKYSSGNKIDPFVLANIGEEFDSTTLVTHNIGAISFTCPTEHCYVKMAGLKPHTSVDLGSEIMDAAGKLIVESYKNLYVRGFGGNIIKLRDDHTAPCFTCDRIHQNENPYAVVGKDGSVRLICRRNSNGGILIGNVKTCSDSNLPTNELTTKQKRRTIKRKLIEKLIWLNKARTRIIGPNLVTISQYLLEITGKINDKKHVAISSILGSGKTKALFDHIRLLGDNKTSVSIIHRRALTANMRPKYKAAGFVIYDEINGEISLKKYKNVLIQYESLHRLNITGCAVDFLICDEINSICMQYLSKLSTNCRSINEYMLETLFRSAKSSLVMDGNLDDGIINAVNCLGSREYYVWNNSPERLLSPNTIISLSSSSFKAEIVCKLKDGKKVEVVASNGPNYCETLKAYILQILPDLKILTIHSKTEDRDIYTADVEKVWIQYDCIIRSPAVGAGVDFSTPYFDYCFVDVNSGGPLADDILQASRRSRNIKTNTYYVNIGKCVTLNLPTTYNGVLHQAENELAHNLTDSMLPDFDGKITDGRFKFRDLNNPLFKFDIWCRVYHNKQRNNIIKRVIEGFIRMGAKFSFLDDVSEDEDKLIMAKLDTISSDLKAVDAEEIASANELSDDEFSDKITQSKISKADRSMINKYVLRAKYGYSGPMDLEWVKKYSDKKILLMNKHIASRDMDIGMLGLFSEISLDNATDIQKLDKQKTSFMYNVARMKARKIFDDYNRSAEFPVRLTEYINAQIDINNPIFGNKKLNGVRLKYSLISINSILNVLGYEIQIKRVHKQITNGTKIYEYEWFDISSNYYNIPDKNTKDNKKPDLPVIKLAD